VHSQADPKAEPVFNLFAKLTVLAVQMTTLCPDSLVSSSMSSKKSTASGLGGGLLAKYQ